MEQEELASLKGSQTPAREQCFPRQLSLHKEILESAPETEVGRDHASRRKSKGFFPVADLHSGQSARPMSEDLGKPTGSNGLEVVSDAGLDDLFGRSTNAVSYCAEIDVAQPTTSLPSTVPSNTEPDHVARLRSGVDVLGYFGSRTILG